MLHSRSRGSLAALLRVHVGFEMSAFWPRLEEDLVVYCPYDLEGEGGRIDGISRAGQWLMEAPIRGPVRGSFVGGLSMGLRKTT